jgi:hypothetical protein
MLLVVVSFIDILGGKRKLIVSLDAYIGCY